MSADARAKALSALARSQVTETAVGDTLHRIAEITLEAIPPAVVAEITMLGKDSHPTTVVYTDPLSPEIDGAQYREGIGPVSAYQSAVELSGNLNQALRSGGVIEQAKGIVMAQSPELTADDAFDLLRRASQRENVKLCDIAQRVIDRRPQTGTRRESRRSRRPKP